MLDLTPRHSDQIATTTVDETVVIITPADSRLYMLNPVASRIWTLADGTRSVTEIARQICAEYEVEEEESLEDTDGMIRDFLDKGMLCAGDRA